MALEAKVKGSYPICYVRALEGRDYIKGEWRAVPQDREEEAKLHPFLDVREAEADASISTEMPVVPVTGEDEKSQPTGSTKGKRK